VTPSGATFTADVTGTTPVDEAAVKPQPRKPLAAGATTDSPASASKLAVSTPPDVFFLPHGGAINLTSNLRQGRCKAAPMKVPPVAGSLPASFPQNATPRAGFRYLRALLRRLVDCGAAAFAQVESGALSGD